MLGSVLESSGGHKIFHGDGELAVVGGGRMYNIMLAPFYESNRNSISILVSRVQCCVSEFRR